jgi:hypothetical protein
MRITETLTWTRHGNAVGAHYGLATSRGKWVALITELELGGRATWTCLGAAGEAGSALQAVYAIRRMVNAVEAVLDVELTEDDSWGRW